MSIYLIEIQVVVRAETTEEADIIGEAIANCQLPTEIEDKVITITHNEAAELDDDNEVENE